MTRRSASAAVAIMAVAGAMPAGGQAQSLWLDPQSDRAVSVEWLHPVFGGLTDDVLNAATFVSFRYPLRSGLVLEGDIPLAYADVPDVRQLVVGNPYLGVRHAAGRFAAEIGVRLPLMVDNRDEAQTVGLFADMDRWEAFVERVVPVTIQANYTVDWPTGFTLRLRGGPSIWIPTEEDGEAIVDYAVTGGYRGARVRIVAGLSGMLIVTEPELNLAERSLHELGAMVETRLGPLTPGLQLRLPIDTDPDRPHDVVLGLHLGVAMP